MNRICKTGIECALFPGEVDSPVVNFSSEAPDPLLFLGTYYPPFDPGCLGCNPNTIYAADNCFGTVYSAVSQADANLLARSAGAICKEPNAQQYTNDPQTASCNCPGGSVFSYTVPAGYMTVAADPDPEAWLAAANAAALAYAEQQAASLVQRDCAATTSLLPHPGWMCLGEELLPGATNTYTITGLNSAGDWNFILSGGALPDGATLDKTGPDTAQISGTPAFAGLYSYTILAFRDASPNITISTTDTLRVIGLTNSTLPDGVTGTAYNEQLATAGTDAPVTFALATGAVIPDGLTLHSDGTIDGTPTTPTTTPFDVTITDAGGRVCTQAVTITVTNPCTPDSGPAVPTIAGNPISPVVIDTKVIGVANTIGSPVSFAATLSSGLYRIEYIGGFFIQQRIIGSQPPTNDRYTDFNLGPGMAAIYSDYGFVPGALEPCVVPDVVTANLALNPVQNNLGIKGGVAVNMWGRAGLNFTCATDVAVPPTGSVTYSLVQFATITERLRVVGLTPVMAALVCPACANATVEPVWDGTLPTLTIFNAFAVQWESNGNFNLNGKAAHAAVLFFPGDHWQLLITCGGTNIWRGYKLVGNTPVGTYMKKEFFPGDLCSATPDCIVLEDY